MGWYIIQGTNCVQIEVPYLAVLLKGDVGGVETVINSKVRLLVANYPLTGNLIPIHGTSTALSKSQSLYKNSFLAA